MYQVFTEAGYLIGTLNFPPMEGPRIFLPVLSEPSLEYWAPPRAEVWSSILNETIDFGEMPAKLEPPRQIRHLELEVTRRISRPFTDVLCFRNADADLMLCLYRQVGFEPMPKGDITIRRDRSDYRLEWFHASRGWYGRITHRYWHEFVTPCYDAPHEFFAEFARFIDRAADELSKRREAAAYQIIRDKELGVL